MWFHQWIRGTQLLGGRIKRSVFCPIPVPYFCYTTLQTMVAPNLLLSQTGVSGTCLLFSRLTPFQLHAPDTLVHDDYHTLPWWCPDSKCRTSRCIPSGWALGLFSRAGKETEKDSWDDIPGSIKAQGWECHQLPSELLWAVNVPPRPRGSLTTINNTVSVGFSSFSTRLFLETVMDQSPLSIQKQFQFCHMRNMMYITKLLCQPRSCLVEKTSGPELSKKSQQSRWATVWC